MEISISKFIKSGFNSISQIMLQENIYTCMLFLLGIFFGSTYMGLGAILATSTATVTAHLFKYEKDNIEKGLYGFSPALVGVAVMLFFKPVLLSWIIIMLGSVMAVVIQHFFFKRKIPVFTLPFVLVTWFFIYLAIYVYPSILNDKTLFTSSQIENYLFAVKGFGQVIFQVGIWSGGLFILGVFIHSPIAGIYGLTGALLAGILAYPFVPTETIANGLISYNAVLCAIVFAGKDYKNFFSAMLSVVFSVIFTVLMMKFNIIALTFPFVLGACLTLLLKPLNPS